MAEAGDTGVTLEEDALEEVDLGGMGIDHGCTAVFRQAKAAMHAPDTGKERGSRGEAAAAAAAGDGEACRPVVATAPSLLQGMSSQLGLIQDTCPWLGRYA